LPPRRAVTVVPRGNSKDVPVTPSPVPDSDPPPLPTRKSLSFRSSLSSSGLESVSVDTNSSQSSSARTSAISDDKGPSSPNVSRHQVCYIVFLWFFVVFFFVFVFVFLLWNFFVTRLGTFMLFSLRRAWQQHDLCLPRTRRGEYMTLPTNPNLS
jgi:hypothetical protein